MSALYKWATAKQVGTSHIKLDLPCQDAVSVREFAGRDGAPWIVLALADGAGSADKAEQGAQYAVHCFTIFIADALREFEPGTDEDFTDLIRRGAALVRDALGAVANHKGEKTSSYAATFLGCATNGQRIAFLQIGDGVILYGETDNWSLAFTPQQGEFVNETYFITDTSALDRVEVKILDHVPKYITLTSDGLEDSLIHRANGEVHPKLLNYFVEAFRAEETAGLCAPLCDQLKGLLVSSLVTTRSDDDTSIITLSIEDVLP